MQNKLARCILIRRIIDHFKTTVNIFDILNSYLFLRKLKGKKLILGFYAQFPPFYNGASIFATVFAKKLASKDEVQLAVIPYKKRIDKHLLKGIPIISAKSKFPDAILFYHTSNELNKFSKNIKKFAWHTIHFKHGEQRTESEETKILQFAKVIIAPTKFAKEQLISSGFNNIVYIPEGVDLQKYSFKKNKNKTVLFVSRTHYYKGVMPFLDSIPSVLKKIPETVFSLHSPIDKYSPHNEEIVLKINELKTKYPDNFFYETKWIPFEKIYEKYNSASILVFPSNNEGFGLPLVEAMASGAVCITTDKAPMNEIIKNNKTGFCLPLHKQRKYHDFEFPKTEDIAKKIIYLLKNESIRLNMALLARKKVEKEYDLDIIMKKLLELLKHHD